MDMVEWSSKDIPQQQIKKLDNLLLGVVNAIKYLLTCKDYELAVKNAIEIVGKVADVDRIRIFQFHEIPDTKQVVISHRFEWVKENFKPMTDNETLQNIPFLEMGFYRWFEILGSGKPLAGLVRHFPDKERKTLEVQGIKAILNCPIFVQGVPWGFISFDNFILERIWLEDEFSILMAAAAGLGSVIQRNKTEEALAKAYEELEIRVQNRTHDLANMNDVLQKEINERKQTEKKLRYLGEHDALTELKNRSYFQEEMCRLANSFLGSVGIIVCDVDGLKLVNDLLGHDAGDALLVDAASVIKMCFREQDIIARIGGDEFAVLLVNTDLTSITHFAKRIKEAISINNQKKSSFPLNISVGVAAGELAHKNILELFKEADRKMYKEKTRFKQESRVNIVQGVLTSMLQQNENINMKEIQELQDVLRNFGQTLGLSDKKIKELALFCLLHYLNKKQMTKNLLLKEKPYTVEEKDIIKSHIDLKHRIIQMVPELGYQVKWLKNHHEWWNGKGYPGKHKEEEIPLECRIWAICEYYFLEKNNPCYIEKLKNCAGKYLDKNLLEVFFQSIKV